MDGDFEPFEEGVGPAEPEVRDRWLQHDGRESVPLASTVHRREQEMLEADRARYVLDPPPPVIERARAALRLKSLGNGALRDGDCTAARALYDRAFSTICVSSEELKYAQHESTTEDGAACLVAGLSVSDQIRVIAVRAMLGLNRALVFTQQGDLDGALWDCSQVLDSLTPPVLAWSQRVTPRCSDEDNLCSPDREPIADFNHWRAKALFRRACARLAVAQRAMGKEDCCPRQYWNIEKTGIVLRSAWDDLSAARTMTVAKREPEDPAVLRCMDDVTAAFRQWKSYKSAATQELKEGFGHTPVLNIKPAPIIGTGVAGAEVARNVSSPQNGGAGLDEVVVDEELPALE